MAGTEKEIAFRKRRRDYALKPRRNYIRDRTTITVKKQKRFYRPENLVARSMQTQIDKKKYETNLKRPPSKNFPQPTKEDKFALVVRIVPKKEFICKEARTILSEFRLYDQFDGVFVSLTDENRKKLKGVSHLIVFGVPTQEYIRQLLHTRAYYMEDGKEMPLTSNKVVSDALSDKGIECVDDMVHAITTSSDALEEVAAFLAPFHFHKIEVPKTRLLASQGGISGWTKDIKGFLEQII